MKNKPQRIGTNIHDKIINYIFDQLGIKYHIDPDYDRIYKYRGFDAVYLDNQTRSWDSISYNKLYDYIKQYNSILKYVEPAGVTRLILVFDKSKMSNL